eukprot:TRINITY_DN2452_c0_g1::TRINITY_DN2452_c0_g1_i2::g.8748::m.8748 TRINITY_DN2452_c0_g1::TRINITY_DN2452_c0_g1_i2::g.8748  ORF type:complete len:123 (-),score=4.13 TRINITY_DN2452_c0_g1_i2:81-449(-)
MTSTAIASATWGTNSSRSSSVVITLYGSTAIAASLGASSKSMRKAASNDGLAKCWKYDGSDRSTPRPHSHQEPHGLLDINFCKGSTISSKRISLSDKKGLNRVGPASTDESNHNEQQHTAQR